MITHFDREYSATKRIKQGKERLVAPFDEIADWISQRWGVAVLNVIYDVRNELHAPRLQIILEHRCDLKQFCDEANFDAIKQRQIGAKFIELCRRDPANARETDGLFVVFSAFAPLALEEADGSLTDQEIENFKQRLGDPDLWHIARCFGEVTFMFYTDDQAAKYKAEGRDVVYAKRYLANLKPVDEFGYLDVCDFTVRFDSKENFDRNYQSSWFNYNR